MNKVNPDLVNKLENYMASGMSMFGQAVTLRKFVSASAGNPDLGIADRFYYQDRPTQMELRILSIEETQLIGGNELRGSMEAICLDTVDTRDEVVYNREVYRILSQPENETIGRTLYRKFLIQRASITGFYA